MRLSVQKLCQRVKSTASLTALAAALVLTPALPALAAPVLVTVGAPYGTLEAGVPVVAFSYDVARVYPAVERQFEPWKPVLPLPASNAKGIPHLRAFSVYYLVHSVQLEHYRDDFRRAHKDDLPMLRDLMPRFDAVFRKYGDRPVDIAETFLHPEDERQLWCQKVTTDLNLVIGDYNNRIGAGEGAMDNYRKEHARWLGKRNEALRYAATQAGSDPNVSFVESVTQAGGVAAFDLPAGVWYVAVQNESYSWYRPIRVTATGGRVALSRYDASRRRIQLADWVGS